MFIKWYIYRIYFVLVDRRGYVDLSLLLSFVSEYNHGS